MKLIADSGSTKTQWIFLTSDGEEKARCVTKGINPFFQQSSEIVETLKNEFCMEHTRPAFIYYYGAGLANQEKKQILKEALSGFFETNHVYAESDLMAASRSLCGKNAGIAAILGTGSNSCFYDGTHITDNVSPLGYILGDEGSGAVLGKKLVSDILKNQFPQHLTKLFYEKYPLTSGQIVEQVYRGSFPNRFLASFTPFLSKNISEKPVYDLVFSSFMAFFKRNISQYTFAHELPVNFTGSISWYFKDVLKEAAKEAGFTVGRIEPDPMPGLLKYHNGVA